MGKTKRVLPPWSKAVKIELVKRDMDVTDLAEAIGLCRPYVSGVVNARAYAPEIAARINQYLELNEEYPTSIL